MNLNGLAIAQNLHLKEFSSDLRNLKNGRYAFSTIPPLLLMNSDSGIESIPTSPILKNIKTKLSSLTNGKFMFGMGVKDIIILMIKAESPEMEITPELVQGYMATMGGLDTSVLMDEIIPIVNAECALDVDSIEFIANNINDLTKTNIVYDEESGEGYIDICADYGFDLTDEDFTLNDAIAISREIVERLKKIEKIFDKKGWKYCINILNMSDIMSPIQTLSNYWIIEPFLKLPEEDMEILNTAHSIKNNICYDENDNIIGEFDTNTLDILSDYDIVTEPNYHTPSYTDEIINDDQGHMMGCFKMKSTGEIISAQTSAFPILKVGIAQIFNNVKHFSSPLSNLTNWNFNDFPFNVEYFESDLPNLKEWCNGNGLYKLLGGLAGQDLLKDNIVHFKANMPSLLTQFSGMLMGIFTLSKNLTSFEGSLCSLKDGFYMFGGSEKLTSFKSDISSLLIGENMFSGTKLNIESLDNIVETINDLSDYPESERIIEIMRITPNFQSHEIGLIDIGLGFNSSDYNGKYGTWDNLKAAFSAKKWKVNFTFADDTEESTTYGLRNITIPKMVYTKLVEVFPSSSKSKQEKIDEIKNNKLLFNHVRKNLLEHYESLPDDYRIDNVIPYHNYTSQDGTHYYRLTHFHDSNVDYSDYDQFGSLEEAVEYYGVKPLLDTSKLKLTDVLKTN